jgi:hypothetical protein
MATVAGRQRDRARVHQLFQQGRLPPPVSQVGRAWLFKRRDIEKRLKQPASFLAPAASPRRATVSRP